MSRAIGVITTSRADFGIYTPILREIEGAPGLRLRLYVTGSHLSKTHGLTVQEIEAAGFPIAARIDTLRSGDRPSDVVETMGNTTLAFGEALADAPPDIVIVLGDRYEMFAAAVAAVPLAIPLAHIHGGEVTEGAMDDSFRHSLTKLSHLHFVSTEGHARRVRQLGESPDRIVVSGAPGLDNLNDFEPLTISALESRVGLEFDGHLPLAVMFHPTTLQPGKAQEHVDALLEGVSEYSGPIVLGAPNADTEHATIRNAFERFATTRSSAAFVEHLGTEAYFSLLHHAAALVGNSSSGIIEAASFRLPVVDIGLRQQGRERGTNVLHVDCSAVAIAEAITKVTSSQFRRRLRTLVNPYGDGTAASTIVKRLASVDLHGLLLKRFRDLDQERL